MNVTKDEPIIKLEFYEEREHDEPAQALMTLHDSVQKMPKKHKTVLQEAVQEVSPVKKIRIESIDGHQDYHKSMDFSSEQVRTMKACHNRIKNTLKQPTGRRWAYYEWFYSNIDRALLLGSNDFEICLQQMFKNLKARKLSRGQWSIIRRLMGKPRRCSPAFFEEERQLLEKKRKKIRYLHQLKGFEVTDMNQFKGLPEEIPMPMVIGTKVTAKVRTIKEEGLNLFTGTVDAVDTSNNTYRISFDREGVGCRSIPDTDVASEDYESMNLQLFIVKERPKIAGGNSPESVHVQRKADRDESASSPARLRLTEALNDEIGGTYGGFPIRFLLHMTALSKAIALKKKYVDMLKKMNSEVELRQPFGDITKDFQKDYAFVVLELEKINKEMDSIFQGIQSFLQKDAAKIGIYDQTNVAKDQCHDTATELVQQSHQILQSERVKELVINLTSLMLQINNIAEEESGAFQLSTLDDAVREIKCSLNPENVKLFEDKVETSITFMKNSLQEEQSMLAPFTSNKQIIYRKSNDKKEPMMESLEFSSTEELDDEDEEEEIDDVAFV